MIQQILYKNVLFLFLFFSLGYKKRREKHTKLDHALKFTLMPL